MYDFFKLSEISFYIDSIKFYFRLKIYYTTAEITEHYTLYLSSTEILIQKKHNYFRTLPMCTKLHENYTYSNTRLTLTPFHIL